MIALVLAAWAGEPTTTLHQEWRRDDAILEPRPITSTWIRALGRQRDPRAARLLEPMLSGEHAEEAAFALTLVPGTAGIHRRLASAPGERREGDLRWAGLEGLGRQGTQADVGLVIDALDAGWPYDEAAARALLRMHRRQIDVSRSRTALDRAYVDPRTEIAVAQTAARILEPGSVRADWRLARTSAARAALLKASGQHVEWGLWDTPVVQVAALGLVQEPTAVEERLRHEDGWIRFAAIEAAGRLALTGALEARLAEVEGAEAAAIHRALGQGIAPGEGVDPRIAAVWVEQQQDPAALVELALNGAPPHVRSAAASRLLELEADEAAKLRLLASSDIAVREAVIEALEPSAAGIEELVLTLRVENDPGPLGVGLAQLIAWREQGTRIEASRFLVSTLKRAMDSRDARVRSLALDLARSLRVYLEPAPASTQVRELILPDGTVTTTVGDLPVLAEVDRYQTAHLYTSRGRITIDLAPEVAPLAVHTFVGLARSGFYTEMPWHRVVPGFVAQAGCPRGDGWGGPGFQIADEVSSRPFVDGAVGIARAARDTGASQIFVMTGPARWLDGDYTWFGHVTEGLDLARTLTPDDVIHTVEIPVAP